MAKEANVFIDDTTQTIGLGKAGEITVDVAKLLDHEAVVNYIFTYGLKQMLNDVHASEKDLAAKIGLSQKKLDSLYRGEVAQSRAAGGDPVKREMLEMAKTAVHDTLKAKGRKISDFSKENLKKAYEAQMKAHEDEYRAKAEAKLAIKPEASADADDIMALLA